MACRLQRTRPRSDDGADPSGLGLGGRADEHGARLERERGQRAQRPQVPPVTIPTPPGLGNAPPLSPLHLAMVHGAIYDAVNAIDGGHQPYLDGLSAPASASKAAAVAQAAHDVLVGLTPASLPLVKTRIDNMLTASLGMIDPGPAKTAGITIGAQAAAAMLLERSTDGRFDVEPFPTEQRRRQVAVGATRQRKRVRPVRDRHAAHDDEAPPVAHWQPARHHEPGVRRGIQRGQGAGCAVGIEPDAGTDAARRLRNGQSVAVHEQGPARNRNGQGLVDDPAGTALRQDEHGVSRRADRLLGQQEGHC